MIKSCNDCSLSKCRILPQQYSCRILGNIIILTDNCIRHIWHLVDCLFYHAVPIIHIIGRMGEQHFLIRFYPPLSTGAHKSKQSCLYNSGAFCKSNKCKACAFLYINAVSCQSVHGIEAFQIVYITKCNIFLCVHRRIKEGHG